MSVFREKEMIENGTHSPLDDLDNQSAVSEIPAYKSANQELAGVLKNLRKLEQHIKGMSLKSSLFKKKRLTLDLSSLW